MTKFENKVNTCRKAKEVCAALREQLTAMQHYCDELQASIIEDLAQSPELFNIAQDKNISIGRVGNNLFTVAYGKRVMRKGDKSADDQSWLAVLKDSDIGHVVNTKYSLNKELIRGEVKSNLLSVSTLKEHGLVFGPTANLNIKKIMSDAEIADLIEASKQLAEEGE